MSDAPFFPLAALGLGLAAEDGIVRRADAAQMSEAGLILRRAAEDAARTAREAAEAYEAERKRGHAEGLAQAAREAAARMLADQKRLEDTLDQIEGELADLVLASVKQILRSFDDETLSREVARTALAAMRSEKRAQLHVPPQSYAAIRAGLEEILSDYPEIELVDVITDPGLVAPNLRLESSLGVVDFRLEATLEDLRRLLGGR